VAAAAKRFIEGGPVPVIKPPKTRRQKRQAAVSNMISAGALVATAAGVWWGATHPAELREVTTYVTQLVGGGKPVFPGEEGSASDAGDGATASGADREPNDDRFTASAVESGQTIAGSLVGSDNDDFYSVRLTDGPRNWLRIRIDDLSSGFVPMILRYDQNGQQVGEGVWQSANGRPVEARMAAAPGGVVYFKLNKYLGSGEYRVTVVNETEHAASATVRGVTDREPNNTAFEAQDVAWGVPILGHIHFGDDDFYRIAVPANVSGEIPISVETFSPEFAPSVTILDGNRQQIETIYTSTSGANAAGTLNVRPGGVYYFHVEGWGILGGSWGDYVLRVGAN
jgi:hypothetical protein